MRVSNLAGAMLTLVAAAVLAVVAWLLPITRVSVLSQTITLLAVAGYAAAAGRGAPPRIRWLLPIGVGGFAAAVAVRVLPVSDRIDDLNQWPTNQSNLAASAQALAHRQISAMLILLGVACLAGAVHTLPLRRRARKATATAGLNTLIVIGAGIVVWAKLRAWDQTDLSHLAGLVPAASPALPTRASEPPDPRPLAWHGCVHIPGMLLAC